FIAQGAIEEYQPFQNSEKRYSGRSHSRIQATPDVLSFTLKRMLYDTESEVSAKDNSHMSFPEKLDITPYCLTDEKAGKYGLALPNRGSLQYQLRAVLVHYGEPDYGHYYLYVSDLGYPKSQWTVVDDRSIHKVRTWDAINRNFGGHDEWG